MISPPIDQVVLWWGPGVLILMVFTYGFLRLAHHWIEKSMQVKSQQMESSFAIARQYIEQFLRAHKSQADALARLASCVEHRESVDSFEHQEILIALKAMHRDLDSRASRARIHPGEPTACSPPPPRPRVGASASPLPHSHRMSVSVPTGGEKL